MAVDPIIIGTVILDASVEEKHKKTNEVTMHPVEQGTDITDHIRQKPDEIEIHGMVTDTPVLLLASGAPSPVDTDNLPVEERAKRADQEFARLMADGETMEVITPLRTYDNMAITSYFVTRNADTGNIIDFQIGLIEIVVVTAQEILSPFAKNPSSSGVNDLGSKTTSAADPSTQKATGALTSAGRFLSGFISGGQQ